jgi:hypothetical protein
MGINSFSTRIVFRGMNFRLNSSEHLSLGSGMSEELSEKNAEVVSIESKAPFRLSPGRTTVNLGEGKSILWDET